MSLTVDDFENIRINVEFKSNSLNIMQIGFALSFLDYCLTVIRKDILRKK